MLNNILCCHLANTLVLSIGCIFQVLEQFIHFYIYLKTLLDLLLVIKNLPIYILA